MEKFKTNLNETDPIIFSLIEKEKQRQNEGLEMIPSESFPSKAVLEALGSVMNNKYSEGYPGKRYYGGCEIIDEVESLAIERAKTLFGCEHVNVQPYSGSPANLEVYFAIANPGDKLMGMNLTQGGHLTHGHKVNASGKLFNFIQYGVNKETHLLDYDEIRKLALEHKPKIIVCGATAYPRKIDFKAFHEICEEIDAYSMADISHIAGLIAGKVHPSPFPFTDIVTTTTHKTLCGPRGAIIMCKKEDRLKEKYHSNDKWNLAQRIDRAVFPGMQGGPHNHMIAAKAVAFGEALKPEFKEFAKQIVSNAKTLANTLIENGLKLITDGTDNHLILVDLTNKNISGKEAEKALDKAGITLNANTIPYDPKGPFNPSGIRMGTPALTCRGMKESEMKHIGELLVKVINNHNNNLIINNIKKEIKELTKQFPMY